jgi:hypothetical protein
MTQEEGGGEGRLLVRGVDWGYNAYGGHLYFPYDHVSHDGGGDDHDEE